MKKYQLDDVITLNGGNVKLTDDQYKRRAVTGAVSKPDKKGISKINKPIMFKAGEKFEYDGEIPKSFLPVEKDADADKRMEEAARVNAAAKTQGETNKLLVAISDEISRLNLEGDNVPDTSDSTDEELATILESLEAVDTPVVALEKGSVERFNALVEVFRKLDPTNEAEFTKEGKPDATVLTEMLGFKISAAERDQAWEGFNGMEG